MKPWMQRFIIVLFVWCACAPGLRAAPTEVERLAKIGEVWFKAKHFHPHLAYGDLDWRAALGKALPAARAAETPEEFAKAVDQMLAVLGDPATRVDPPASLGAGEPVSEKQLLHWQQREDGILVVGLNAVSLPPPVPQIRTEFGNLMGEIRSAKGLLLDLRLPPTGGHARSAFSWLSDRLISVLISTPLDGPSRRRLVHHGLARADLIDAGYYSAFEVTSAAAFRPFPNIKDCPTVFVLNRHSPWPPFAQAMVASGKATAVFEGDGQPHDAPSLMQIPLEAGWTATIRLEEWIFPDSSVMLEPNLRVQEGRGIDQGLQVLEGKTAPPPKKTLISATPVFRDTYWSVSSDAPYPAIHDRLAAAFQLWGIVEYFYPHRSQMNIDWTGILKQFIPRIIEASNELEYHLAIAEMCAFVRDSHLQMPDSNVIGRNFFPVSNLVAEVRIVEGVPVIWRVGRDVSGIQPGDIVRRVDGEEAVLRLARLRKYISASTEQAMQRHSAWYLLAGSWGTDANVEVENQQGVRHTVTIPRVQRPRSAQDTEAPPATRLIEGEIAYVDLSRVAAGELERTLERFQKSAAIIFDLRRGGSWSQSKVLLRLLATNGGPLFVARTPVITGKSISEATGVPWLLSVEEYEEYEVRPAEKPVYTGRIAVLMDENTQSASEGLAYLLGFCGAKLIGGPTTGANGNSTNFVLPGGLRIGLTGVEFKYMGPAGEIQQQRVGVRPDIAVAPTIAGLRAGRDEVLERALDFAKNGK